MIKSLVAMLIVYADMFTYVLEDSTNAKKGKSSVSELYFFLNVTTVINNIIIKKGINYLLSGGKSTAKSVYYLHSWSVNDGDIP